MEYSDSQMRQMRDIQRTEMTEHILYRKLAKRCKDRENRSILEHISKDELEHYRFWKKQTGADVGPSHLRVWKYYLISVVFGITFGIKLMGGTEERAQKKYKKLTSIVPDAKNMLKDEHEHEKKLVGLIDEERMRYVGSTVLGINDALVEITGALAGYTLALQSSPLIAMVGTVTGIAAALSMAVSEYLSTKSEETVRSPAKAAFYTGTAYIGTVVLLVLPFILMGNIFAALSVTVVNALLVILLFNVYISTAKGIPFWRRFFEMAGLSMGVAALSFGIGFIVRMVFGVEI